MLVGSMQYYAELFEEETMVVMMRRLEHLLEEVAENPQQSIDAVGLLSLAEREQLESGWSGPAVVQRVKETLPELVEYWAEQKPESTALVSGDGEELSYAELERASSLVGKRLRKEGVRAGAVVGIWVEGMREWLIAAVGVLKAGGVFLPVEAAGPASRREQMLKDAGGAWLITEEELLTQRLNSGVKLLRVNELMGEDEAATEERKQEDLESVAVVIDGASVACVMYRSGRRGKPESIWLNQRTLCGTGALRVGEEDRVALRLSVEEEAGVLELLRVIAAGGCVLEMSKALVRAPRKMAEMLEEQGSTVMWGKGAELERLGREFAESLEQVRAVVCVEGWEGQRWAAEALPEELLERVYGTYGTVETGGAGVLYGLREMRGNGERAGIRMNGVAAGKRVYVLDGEMRGVPEGLVGEIYIGGEEQGLWRGDGEETAWSWVPDQWSERAGARLYRTGDLGRRRKDGVLEHVGRKDRQAMVAGVRVHEEEIEAVLRKTAGVAEAAVVIGVNGNKDGKLTGRTEITAWVERSDKITSQNGFFVEELLKEMKRELPEAMVPQRVIEVEEWPRRNGGEIDRGALVRKLVQAAGETEYTPARTEEEARLVGIWEETLEKKPIGVHDSFFSVGGNSLLATQLVARMSAALKVELPLRRLFEFPTIAQLAPVVTELKQKGGWRKPPIQKISRDGELELSFAQQRLWFLMQVMPGNTSYHIPMALRIGVNLIWKR